MRTSVGLLITLIVAAAGIFAFSPRTTPALDDSRIPVHDMQLNAIVETAAGLVTAGELGHILVSDDGGRHWERAELSTQRHALITRLRFSDDGRHGLAIGHEGWILRTEDGGRYWQEVAFDSERGEPLLDLAQLPSGRWMAVGAFGRVLRSDDSGLSWQPVSIPGNTDWHLNAIRAAADGRHWLIVGEAGTAFRSLDGGESWAPIPAFYEGSLYGARHLGEATWVAYGMRGNVFRSEDHGASWQAVPLDLPLSLFADLRLPGGTLLLAGQGGTVLASHDRGRSFSVVRRQGKRTLTDLALTADGDWLLTSNDGLQRIAGQAQTAQANALPLLASDAGA
ncbi:MAG: YCF48-related protein [Halomonas sp.]|nr:YCF48-related protein [Halomonas sp.]